MSALAAATVAVYADVAPVDAFVGCAVAAAPAVVVGPVAGACFLAAAALSVAAVPSVVFVALCLVSALGVFAVAAAGCLVILARSLGHRRSCKIPVCWCKPGMHRCYKPAFHPPVPRRIHSYLNRRKGSVVTA